jgi:uncharacterized protein
MSTKTIVVHHNDPDGWCSAAIIYKWLAERNEKAENYEFMEYSYEKNPEILLKRLDRDTIVIMADFSFKMDVMKTIMDKVRSFTWIDHHISAIKDYEEHKVDGIEAILDKSMAGCENTWKHFFKGQAIPPLVELIGVYDSWRNKDEKKWKKALYAMYGLKTFKDCSDPKSKLWTDIIEDNNTNLLDRGEIAKNYQDTMNMEAMKRTAFETELKVSAKDGNVTTVKPFKAIASNSPNCNSMLFDCVDIDKYDVMISFYVNNRKDYSVSFYSVKDNVDCSVIAKTFKGGGHKGAAGCQVKELPFELTDRKPEWKV